VKAPAKQADILATSTLRHSRDHRARNTPFNQADPMAIPGGIAMPDIELLKRQLQRDVARGGVVETQRLVLAFGQPFFGIERPKGLRLGPKKMCFKNASNVVIRRTGKEEPSRTPYYVEGYALTHALTRDQHLFHHAWIAFEGKYAVELTLKDDPQEIAFFGILFSHSDFSDLLHKKKEYGFLSWPIPSFVNEFFNCRTPSAAS
jgi:hypothetical protein